MSGSRSTSPATLLGVAGDQHPFPIYRAVRVPTVLSTDDEGIEPVDRTHELRRAVTTYHLSWADLVGLEPNMLEDAFVVGDSLWVDPILWRRVDAGSAVDPRAEPTAACAAFLSASQKARLQWALQRDLAAFDHQAAGMTLTEQ